MSERRVTLGQNEMPEQRVLPVQRGQLLQPITGALIAVAVRDMYTAPLEHRLELLRMMRAA